MIRLSLLRHHLGHYRTLMLLAACIAMWCLSIGQVVVGAGTMLILWWSAGLLVAALLRRSIRHHTDAYQGWIGCLGILLFPTLILLQWIPIATRDRWAWVVLIAASFYCHSAIWFYGTWQGDTDDSSDMSDPNVDGCDDNHEGVEGRDWDD